jgi:antirestriction protein ArdC
MTYKQATEAGGQVRKSEKSASVVFMRKLIVKEDKELERQITMLRTFRVFNVAQIDGLPLEPSSRLRAKPRKRRTTCAPFPIACIRRKRHDEACRV